jgi:hypothetical protein
MDWWNIAQSSLPVFGYNTNHRGEEESEDRRTKCRIPGPVLPMLYLAVGTLRGVYRICKLGWV